MKRRRSKSRSEAVSEEDSIALGLQRFLDKLKASQPAYVEDDVAEIPFLSDSTSPCPSPPNEEVGGSRMSGSGAVAEARKNGTVELEVPEKDAPLSPGLFLTSVNLFEPKMISKSRRASTDALRLLQQGYALVWSDPKYLNRPARSLSPSPLDGPRAVSPSPSPAVSPSPALLAKLDECMQVLLIYANTSPALAQLVSQENYLHLLCFIGSHARETESNATATRRVERELKQLGAEWERCGLGGRVTDTLRECYLLDFLLDYALPPAVCSAKYEGLHNTLLDRKHRIILDMVNSRNGFSTLMERIPLQGLSGLVAMSAHCDVKVRMRLLDKMASEGVIERLAEEMELAVVDLRRTERAEESRATSPPSKGVSPSPRRRGRPSLSPSKRASPTGKKRSSGIPPPQHDPVGKIGLCIDIFLMLTKPNLRHPYETEEMLRNPKTANNAVVRSTVWAGREGGLRKLCAHLLWLVCHARGVVGSLVLLLQEQAADCLLHLAAYSGYMYGLVVHTIDSLIQGELSLSEVTAKDSSDRIQLANPSGLLPIFLQMLFYDMHCEANTASIVGWFQYLSESLVPQAFEAPALTNGRRSTTLWDKKRKSTTPAAPILARDITREEMRQLSPYFTFAIHLVQLTTWREGAEAFLAKMALLSYHVMLHTARRPNLFYGQASSCYDVVAPLLAPAAGHTPGEETPERTPSKRGRSKSRSTPAREREVYFIPSPVRSPVFYEAYSPHSTSHTDSPGKRETADSSPENVTRSWRDRLSLRLWFSAFRGDEEEDGVKEN